MNKEEQLKKLLVGNTIRDVIVHNSHGESIELSLQNEHEEKWTRVIICSFIGTRWEKEHSSEDVCITVNGELIKD